MSFRSWFDRQSPAGKAVSTVGLTGLMWIVILAVLVIVSALMGYAWWR